MIPYIVRRLLLLIPMVVGLVVATFLLLLLIPGDPAQVLLGQDATPEAIAQLHQNLGLDQPWFVRLGVYFVHLAHGDLGTSIMTNQPNASLILERLPATLELAITSLIL